MKCGPILFKTKGALALFVSKTDCRNVVRQCFEPNIHCVVRIVRDGHPPANRGPWPAYRQILKTAAHEAYYFIVPRLGSDEVRPVFIKRQQRLIIVRQTKEIAVFRDPIQSRIMNQASWRSTFRLRLTIFILSLVSRTRSAKPTFIVAFVYR